MSEIVVTTQTEAVNVMLSAIGEASISSLTPPLPRAATLALLILEETQKEVLSEGWNFNTEREVSLAVSGTVTVPTDVISVDISPGYEVANMDLVLRGTTLFNRAPGQNTATFAAATLKVDYVRLLAFTSIPEVCRTYIVARATRKLYDRVTSPEGRNNALLRDELDAKRRFMADEGRNADHNVFNNWSVGRTVFNRPGPLSTL